MPPPHGELRTPDQGIIDELADEVEKNVVLNLNPRQGMHRTRKIARKIATCKMKILEVVMKCGRTREVDDLMYFRILTDPETQVGTREILVIHLELGGKLPISRIIVMRMVHVDRLTQTTGDRLMINWCLTLRDS